MMLYGILVLGHKKEWVIRYACGLGHKQGVEFLRKLTIIRGEKKFRLTCNKIAWQKKEGSQKLGYWVTKQTEIIKYPKLGTR